MSAPDDILLIAFPDNSDHQGIFFTSDRTGGCESTVVSPVQGYAAYRDFTDSTPTFAVSNDAGNFLRRRDYITRASIVRWAMHMSCWMCMSTPVEISSGP
jgi:hypothetical protein